MVVHLAVGMRGPPAPIVMMIDTVEIRSPTMLRRGSRTASSAKRKTALVYRDGSNTSR